METKPPFILIILTLITFAFPLYTQIIWALVSGSNTHEEGENLFLRHFPTQLSLQNINYLSLALSVVTAVLAELWRRRDSHLGKTIAFLVLIAAVIISIYTLFQIVS